MDVHHRDLPPLHPDVRALMQEGIDFLIWNDYITDEDDKDYLFHTVWRFIREVRTKQHGSTDHGNRVIHGLNFLADRTGSSLTDAYEDAHLELGIPGGKPDILDMKHQYLIECGEVLGSQEEHMFIKKVERYISAMESARTDPFQDDWEPDKWTFVHIPYEGPVRVSTL